MSLFNAIKKVNDIYDRVATNHIQCKSNSKYYNEELKEDSDKGAYMEYIMEHEENEIIKKKLKWRLGSGVYEWKYLYNN